MSNTTAEGKIVITSKSIGYVRVPDIKEDIMVQPADLKKSLSGDTVRVQLGEKNDDGKIEGKVTHIVSRYREQFVGTRVGDFIEPDNRKIHIKFILSQQDLGQVNENDKVLVKMTDWPEDSENPNASLVKIFGQKGNHEVEIQSIIYDKGFVSDFPAAVEKNAEDQKAKWVPIPEDEIAKRRDLRKDDIMTIDPVDAKDFDDALSIKELENGNYEVGIHIADVSHFVTPGSELDKEAFDRSFSVYLVDRTIPMLPEILSNEICSLNPNEDTLAFSAIFEMTKDAKVVSRWFGKTVIHSHKRFTYEEAQAVLDAESGPYVAELQKMNLLAKIMEKQNAEAGAINFESEEIKFELDKDGRPLRIVKKERMDTHKLVERFMLLANREVAKFIFDENKKRGDNEIGLMYRTHDVPNPEKISDLASFLKAMGYILPINDEGEVTAKGLNQLFDEVEGKPEETLIKTAAIRTMSKAIYSTQNLGHFGLSFPFYTHFTSPIRRYPDLLVHRILQKFLLGETLEQAEKIHFKEAAVRASEREISAAEAERESIKYKQAEYLQDHIGEIYEGVISGVSAWGIYVVLDETLSEGMVHISKLGNDYFSLDEKKYTIVGERTGEKFSLGDKVKVKVEKIDLDKKNVDFALAK